jgi:uncharacterized protein
MTPITRKELEMTDQATMTRGARNEALARTGYEAFARGDLVVVQQAFAPDITWHAQRLGQLGGDHVGWPAVLAFFARTMELTAGTFRIEIEQMLSNDDGVAVVVRSRATRDGATLDSRQIHLFRVVDDLVAEVWQFVDDGQTVGAFWA